MKLKNFLTKEQSINEKNLYTSEYVTEGHPDKLADQISDGVLDAILSLDPYGRVACECLGSGNLWTIGGEITANISTKERGIEKSLQKKIRKFSGSVLENASLNQLMDSLEAFENDGGTFNDFIKDSDVQDWVYATALEQIVLDVIEEVYNRVGYSLDGVSTIVNIQGQSPDIALGTNEEVGGAGDQGIMFGYAIDDTDNFMPLGYELARLLGDQLVYVRKSGEIEGLLPDAKTQVTIDLETNVIHTVVVSTQHEEQWSNENMDTLRALIVEKVILPVLDDYITEDTNIYINQTGNFVIGGIVGDAGLTGRKIIVDTYGSYSRHGGGAFSGKDATKVDRSGAYIARYLAKNIVAKGYAHEVTIQLGYVIGKSEPVSLLISSPDLSTEEADALAEKILTTVDLTPRGIIEKLDLRKPIFSNTSTGGHFGRDEFTWEQLDLDI